MSKPVIVSMTVRVPMNVYNVDELRAAISDQMRSALQTQAEQAGLVLGEEDVRTVTFVKVVKDHHHEHGWQMVEQGTSADDAEMAVCSIESTATRREKATA